ncbi:hypothetical protein GYH30_010978 [Glycine max]|uniref:Uncharacterized protein n=2 Tax=Glycine subgen. Soja TaxID=1462606 RepID=I1JZ07_SOYBN|nr:hypothetical protein JHK86_011232 [Glycine max]KAH1113033.1 hypothetical protein GYH30_010978 [Glycine max]KHN44291.1 hypothetical protein glysoja_024511 [Glycine soja]RZC18178.1 hypothetical protein D0Y65_010708 [Glycine soja]
MGMDQGAGMSTKKYETKVKNKKNAFASVIPAPRKSVKRMVFESLVEFFVNLFPCDPRKKRNMILAPYQDLGECS